MTLLSYDASSAQSCVVSIFRVQIRILKGMRGTAEWCLSHTSGFLLLSVLTPM